MEFTMIKEINGNLLDFPSNINIIVHQTNCKNAFGAGIALQIKKRYPQAYKADTDHYDNACQGVVHNYEISDAMLGTISHACVHKELERYVVNLYGQIYPSATNRATNYEAFANGLEQLKTFTDDYPRKIDPIIGFPRGIGCGLGGGSWRVIQAMIEDFHEVSGHDVYIVNFQMTQAASASLKKAI